MTSNHHQQLIEKASRQAKSLQLDEIHSNLLVKLALLLFDFNDFFYSIAIATAWRKFDVNGDETVINHI